MENRSPKEFVKIILKKLVNSGNTMSEVPDSKNVNELNEKHSKEVEYPSFNISNHTSKKITIIGAAGDVGKQIINRLILQQILLPRDKLQLIEKTGQFSLLKGLSLDFADAYASYLPNIEVISNPEEIDGDIIVMAAGVPNTDIRQDRSDLAKFNKFIFERYAKNIRPNSHAFVIVVSNPIELGVDIFGHSDNFDRKKILGIGAFHDTLRFRREIAKNLDIPRSHVNAFVIGTHSRHMIPL